MTDAVIDTHLGRVRGVEHDGVVAFLGIPYAAPPTGPLRFAAPTEAAAWDGVRECVRFGPAAPQSPPAPGVPPIWRPDDGPDCLTLNIWTPDPSAAGLPVMVWIHGGMWRHGATEMPQYDGATPAAEGVVVVTVNYRLGFEGFGHLPGAPGNRGLRDQLAALRWVRRAIGAFGGDPDRVTVFGQSAGAASIALLMGTSDATGLFHRAIAQSIPAGLYGPDQAAATTAAIARAAGIAPTPEDFAALPPQQLLAAQDAVAVTGRRDGLGLGPVVDGDMVTGSPASGAARRPGIDLICGFTHAEYLGHGPIPDRPDLTAAAAAVGLDHDAIATYRRAHPGHTDADLFREIMSDALVRIPTLATADAHARAGGRTWLYDFTWPAAERAAHGIDIPFVFGNSTSRYAARLLGTPLPPEFDALSREIRTAWTAFATTGDPGWPAFDPRERHTMRWDTPSTVVADPLAAVLPLWSS